MTVVKTQSIQQDEFLLSQAKGMRSRDQVTVTVAGGVLLPSGTTLGVITATGKYIKHVNAASDGSQVACAVLSTPLDGGDIVNGDYQATVYSRDCEVNSALLNGGAGLDTGAGAELKTFGIVPR